MKMIKKFILCFILIAVCFNCKCLLAQNKETFIANMMTYKKLTNALKKTRVYRLDTTEAGFGEYEKIISPFFDKELLQKRIKEADNPLDMTENVAFMFQQSYIATLQTYLKKIPAKNLEIIPESLSKSIDSNWRKNSNEEEIIDIENSLLLVFKNKSKQINLISLIFNPKTNKVIYLLSFGHSIKETEYLKRFMGKN